ncbi:hypothetical protein EPUL_002023 [Erysiphe pulchra]|uniref:Ran-binding-domain-containing protein n=1 Tax=Erysiphe pulchra TaxID=225359 RepID=A0A2S4PQ66_9PEZI|nr:hypothetical protein EPUL_002023 [Erysiphe pulchra]
MNYAIRSGIGITASFAISQTSRLLRTVSDRTDYRELYALQERLDSKIRIISPAIDLIELISARGNTTLESAITLTRALRWDIQSLGARLEKAANAEEKSRKKTDRASFLIAHKNEVEQIVKDIKRLIVRIEDAVPLINLAITTSGVNLSTTLPPSVSPSRLLQASTFLTAGDTQYFVSPGSHVQIGPTFTLTLYMLFAGHLYPLNHNEDGIRETTWKEVIHKARVKLMRSPINGLEVDKRKQMVFDEPQSYPSLIPTIENPVSPSTAGQGHQNEYSYYLEIIEDLEDDRLHSQEDGDSKPGPYRGVNLAGIREYFPIFQIGKIFYADTGKILNIGCTEETNSPVLLLKRDINAKPPRRMMDESEIRHEWCEEPEESNLKAEEFESQDDASSQIRRESSISTLERIDEQSSVQNMSWHLPAGLDPEWLAFEVYAENEELDTEDERECGSAFSGEESNSSTQTLTSTELTEEISCLRITPDPSRSSSPLNHMCPDEASSNPAVPSAVEQSPFGPIRSSLSLLEMLIRLTSLQQFQQASHLSIPDELLSFFLEESSTTGAGTNDEERKRTRRDARRKVGFDPYDESPIKRHGEDYQLNNSGQKNYQARSSPRIIEKRSSHFSQSQDYIDTPELWLLRNRAMNSSSTRNTPDNFSSSPLSYRSQKKRDSPFEMLHKEE